MNYKFDDLPEITLHKGKELALKRMHPWVFSGAVAKQPAQLEDGTLVKVTSYKGEFLATGHYHDGSIKIRLLTYQPVNIDQDFWIDRLENAWNTRKALLLADTNAFRLVHGEGDGLPGLVIDYYNNVAVFQAHSIGMHRAIDAITHALKTVIGPELAGIYDKSKETLPEKYARELKNGFVFGNAPAPHVVSEYGRKFEIDFDKGQKTGFFLDQRENRKLLAHYSSGKRILNTFCYSGGFSVFGLSAGASEVVSVDISEKAMVLCRQNVELNQLDAHHTPITADVMKWLGNSGDDFDIVILDPPAFAKSLSARHRALQGYKRLNIEGIKRVKPGGLLFTFSCSQVVDRELFYNTVVAAAMEAGRPARVLHHLTQGPDHPVNIFHPEGHYLKGLVLQID